MLSVCLCERAVVVPHMDAHPVVGRARSPIQRPKSWGRFQSQPAALRPCAPFASSHSSAPLVRDQFSERRTHAHRVEASDG
jgi:hypothetical protein